MKHDERNKKHTQLKDKKFTSKSFEKPKSKKKSYNREDFEYDSYDKEFDKHEDGYYE